MSGYAKVFDSMFTGSMRGQADPQLVMVFLIAHAHNGVVDCHFRAISDATGLSVARVTKAIHYLEGPDPESRSPAENGRRIVRLDAHRNWGWRIVNHEVYRSRMSSLDDSYHENKRQRQQRYRDRRHERHVASRDATPASASASVRTSFRKCETLFFGPVPEDLRILAERLSPGANAGCWQDYVQAEIEGLGYEVKREVPCVVDEDTGGRIDLVVRRGSVTVAVELDNRTPRAKSIRKVSLYPAGMILLRDPKLESVDLNQPVCSNEAHRPSLDEAIAYGQNIGLAPWRSRDWWQEMESCGWLDYQRRPVSNWRAMVSRVKTKWEADGRPNGPPKSKAYPQLPLENCI